MADKIYLNSHFGYREDTLANWQASDPILERGEISFVRDGSDGKFLKIGDGKTQWTSLPYAPLPKGEKGDKGEQGVQGEKGDKGDTGTAGKDGSDGKDAVTDMTYSPTSENAQSGIAVAEAVSGKANKEEWELINTITVTSDTDGSLPTSVIFSTDSDGNSFDLEKVKIICRVPKQNESQSVQLWLKNGSILAAYTQLIDLTRAEPTYSIYGEYREDWDFETIASYSGACNAERVYKFPKGNRYSSAPIPKELKTITLMLSSSGTVTIPEGTEITIWGVRK